MRIVIVAAGSTGDVLPYTGVAARLVERGHEVALAVASDVTGLVTARGLTAIPLPISVRELTAEFSPQPGLRGRLDTVRRLGEQVTSRAEIIGRGALAAVENADLAVVTPLSAMLVALTWGEIPTVGLYLQPMMPTRNHAPVAFGLRSLGPLNRAAGRWYLHSSAGPSWPVVQRLRAERGLPPLPAPARYLDDVFSQARWPLLQGFSRHVVPDPADLPGAVRTVGYCWPLPAPNWTPPADLIDFLEAGDPPVVVSFGSMPVGDATGLRRTVLAAARSAGLRVIFQAGWAGLTGDDEPDVLHIGHVPHEWLLPRAAAFVHHAGAGTSAAGLRAGVPAVPVPVLLDQPFWAHRLAALGVAWKPIPLHRLTADRLANALRLVTTDASYRRRAGELAALLDQEDGAGVAAAAIERIGTGLPLDGV